LQNFSPSLKSGGFSFSKPGIFIFITEAGCTVRNGRVFCGRGSIMDGVELERVLVVLFSDLDDTMTNTTVDLQDGRDIHHLTAVPGVYEYLVRRPGQVIIASIAEEEELQRSKLSQIGVLHLVRDVLIMGDLASKTNMVMGLAKKYQNEGRLLIGVGDRLDNDITLFNKAGMLSVRMMVSGGKYASQVPSFNYEQPDYIVTNWFELEQKLKKIKLPC